MPFSQIETSIELIEMFFMKTFQSNRATNPITNWLFGYMYVLGPWTEPHICNFRSVWEACFICAGMRAVNNTSKRTLSIDDKSILQNVNKQNCQISSTVFIFSIPKRERWEPVRSAVLTIATANAPLWHVLAYYVNNELITFPPLCIELILSE